MFGNGYEIFSVREINRIYPNQWVAITVVRIDADGFALEGEVIVHNSDERFVWSAVKLQETDEPVYVFYTGPGQPVTVAA